jgi:hypothetical protein
MNQQKKELHNFYTTSALYFTSLNGTCSINEHCVYTLAHTVRAPLHNAYFNGRPIFSILITNSLVDELALKVNSCLVSLFLLFSHL